MHALALGLDLDLDPVLRAGPYSFIGAPRIAALFVLQYWLVFQTGALSWQD